MNERVLANFSVALEAVTANKLRSVLTALGIIFGVAAVIAMLAIGAGAQEEILEQIKLVGVNNIVISPVVEQTEESVEESSGSDGQREKKKFSPGLSLLDAESIEEVIPGIDRISPEILLDTYIIKNGIRRSAKLVGVNNFYFQLANFELESGEFFSSVHIQEGERVCIIGNEVGSKFFSEEDPLGKTIKVGNQWLRVIGVLKRRFIAEEYKANLGLRDFNMDVYTPINTVLIRYRNRASVTSTDIANAQNQNNNGDDQTQGIEQIQENRNYHQLDRLVVQTATTERLTNTAEVISRMLRRRHYQVVDFEVTIPELLLKQQQQTKQIFNIVLGALAGISLLVGGIGIMNIMLASVMERIKEIGLRLAVGAQKSDIITQFLFEAMLISIVGGMIGILLGMVLAAVIANIADIPTIITMSSVALSFGVAATVGLIFGIAPARKAASQNPINSLRYE